MGDRSQTVELLELGKDISYVRMNGKEIPIDTKRFINNILSNISELMDRIKILEGKSISPIPDDKKNS